MPREAERVSISDSRRNPGIIRPLLIEQHSDMVYDKRRGRTRGRRELVKPILVKKAVRDDPPALDMIDQFGQDGGLIP